MPKVNVIKTYPDLWEWILKTELPQGLVAHKHSHGYGYETYIEQKGTGTSTFLWCSRNKVARVGDYEIIDVYHPNWFSDIEALATKWERFNGKKVTINVYEAATLD